MDDIISETSFELIRKIVNSIPVQISEYATARKVKGSIEKRTIKERLFHKPWTPFQKTKVVVKWVDVPAAFMITRNPLIMGSSWEADKITCKYSSPVIVAHPEWLEANVAEL